MAEDPTLLLQEVLKALQTLQRDQGQLASNIDAISGRVNILSGIKEVKDAANKKQSDEKLPATTITIDSHESHDHADPPESPSVTVVGGFRTGTPSTTTTLASLRNTAATSRIILTYVLFLDAMFLVQLGVKTVNGETVSDIT